MSFTITHFVPYDMRKALDDDFCNSFDIELSRQYLSVKEYNQLEIGLYFQYENELQQYYNSIALDYLWDIQYPNFSADFLEMKLAR